MDTGCNGIAAAARPTTVVPAIRMVCLARTPDWHPIAPMHSVKSAPRASMIVCTESSANMTGGVRRSPRSPRRVVDALSCKRTTMEALRQEFRY